MSIARAFTWPIRRLLDPRFGGLAQQADSQHQDLVERFAHLNERVADRDTLQAELATMRGELAKLRQELIDAARADMEATRETNEMLGRSLGDLLDEATASTTVLEQIATLVRLRLLEDGSIEDVDAGMAEFLNYASSHRGFAAQRGLWFNPPISLAYEAGKVRPADTNERIVELPYVYRALAGAKRDASILDVGAAESTLAFSLASFGYDVTALDLHPYPLSHPRLTSVEADILKWETDRTFDAVVCLSTLEHIGLGAYGEEPDEAGQRADVEAVRRMHALTRPGGVLVLTVPFGPGSRDTTQRSYDRADLERVLEGWAIEELTVVRRQDELTWVPENGSERSDGARRVALVTARRPRA